MCRLQGWLCWKINSFGYIPWEYPGMTMNFSADSCINTHTHTHTHTHIYIYIYIYIFLYMPLICIFNSWSWGCFSWSNQYFIPYWCEKLSKSQIKDTKKGIQEKMSSHLVSEINNKRDDFIGLGNWRVPNSYYYFPIFSFFFFSFFLFILYFFPFFLLSFLPSGKRR